MSHRLGPFELNPLTNEPLLRLRKHPEIIITPPRLTDVPLIIPPLNDERVYTWLLNSPYPYLIEHAEQFIGKTKLECDQGVKELLNYSGAEGALTLSQSPVRCLREIQADGGDIFLGDIGISRCTHVEKLLENPKCDKAANLALPAGHPDIVWTIGDYLVPSHHGRGIMTDAVDTIINDLAKPCLGTRQIVVTTFVGNEGSMKVFEKNGFRLLRQLINYVEAKGKLHSLNVLVYGM